MLNGETMGTQWNATLLVPLGEVRSKPYQKIIQDVLDDVNHKMSTWNSRSELSLFNESQSTSPQPMSRETLIVLEAAKSVHTQSSGAFDVTVGPLVRAWGFGIGESEEPPSDEEIALMLSQIGSDHLSLDLEAKTATKQKAALKVDLSAIAKGFAVDQTHSVLIEEGLTDFMIEVGGEVKTMGVNAKGQTWAIGIEQPDAPKNVLSAAIAIENMAVATSGDYRNYKEKDGKRISHTIDPRTGKPITHRLASVTVIAESAMMADAWATALNVLGPTEGMDLANSLSMPIMMIVRNEEGKFEFNENKHFKPYGVKLNQ